LLVCLVGRENLFRWATLVCILRFICFRNFKKTSYSNNPPWSIDPTHIHMEKIVDKSHTEKSLRYRAARYCAIFAVCIRSLRYRVLLAKCN
jgi:hypothetical protein